MTTDSRASVSDEVAAVPATRSARRSWLLRRELHLVAFIALFIVLVTLVAPDFASVTNFKQIIENMALESIVMAAMVLLLAAGRFDLSVDGVAAVSAIVGGILIARVGVSPLVAVVVALLIGAGIGLINGLLIERLGLNPLMTTLATWWITTGAALGLTGGIAPSGFPDSFLALGQTRFLGLLATTWYAIAIVPVLAIVLWLTKFGYHVKATGGDRDSARLNAVRVAGIGLILFTITGLASAFAGVMFSARLGSASPVALDGMALNVIAAAVIGGASLYGGRGSVLGGLLGLFLLNMINSASIYVGVSPFWQRAISGVILLVAILADVLSEDSRLRMPRPWRRRTRTAPPS